MVEVRLSPQRGRGLFTTAPIRGGDLLVRALPYVIVPNDEAMATHCCICLSTMNVSALACCSHAVTCARCAASKQAALVHADECAALQSLFAAPASERPRDTRSLRLLMRLLCARWRERCCGPGEQYISSDGEWWGDGDVAADDFEDVLELTEPPAGAATSAAELASGAGVPALLEEAMAEVAKQARFYLGGHARLGLAEATSLMGRLASNSLTLYAPDRRGGVSLGPEVGVGAEVGVALSASVAMLNHSCDPNADWALDADGCLVVRATRDVPAGAELFLSYVDPRMSAAARRAKLAESFFFDCACDACDGGVSRWSCALCATLNGPFEDVCTGAACAARRDAFACPLARKERRVRRRRAEPGSES